MKKNYWLMVLIGVLTLGIGYAAIANISLAINGGASSKGNATDENFIVRFVQSTDTESEWDDVATAALNPASYEVSNGSTAEVTASVIDDENATFSITGLSSVGEKVTFKYYATNLSEGLPAYVFVDVDNSNNNQEEYFKITRRVENGELIDKGDVTAIYVTVEVLALPELDLTGSFNVKLVASPYKNTKVTTGGVSSVYTTAYTKDEIDDLLEDDAVDNVYLTISEDVDYGNTNTLVIPEGKNVTIDLNGNNITGSIIAEGDLTIDGEGTITGSTAKEANAITVKNGATLTVNGGEIISNTWYGVMVSDGEVIINDGTFHTKEAVFGSNNTQGDMNLTINGGTFTADQGFVVYMPTPATLTVNDGTLNGGISFRMGTVNINGGSIYATTGDIDSYKQYYAYQGEAWFGDAIELLGGTYALGANSSAANNNAVLNISGGNIVSNNGVGTALVVQNLGKYEQNIQVNISGGNFSTNAPGRETFEIMNSDDIGTTDGYKTYNNEVNVTITGGTGLTGITETGVYTTSTGPTYVAPNAGDTHKGIVYLDPTDLKAVCNDGNSVSATGTKEGCMKWYVFDDSGDNYTMILDHNTTSAIKWYDSNVNVEYSLSNLKGEVDALVTTSNWKVTPRLISATEVKGITNNQDFSLATSDWYCLGSGEKDSPDSEPLCNAATNKKYAWLFDYTSNCTSYGCNVADSSNNGYWTSTTVGDSFYVWFVYKNGSLNNYTATSSSAGVRPVITLSKNLF